MRREGSKKGGDRRDGRSGSRQLNKRKPRGDNSKSRPPRQQSNSPGPLKRLQDNPLSQGIAITDNKQLLSACQGSPQLKVSDTPIVFNPNIILKDVSLRVKGPQEDEIYAGHKGIYLNVRRGNSFVMFKDTHTVICARKGLRKFFDLYPEYLEYNLANLASLEGKIGVKSANENKSIHKKIFGDLKEFLDGSQGTVKIVETNKANGENCQISWVPDCGCWAIASKNVCVLLRSVEDISLYVGDRFHFAEIIAREWFAQMKKFTQAQIDSIKECLKDYTLIGEYTGNQNYQHLVKYEKQGFLFYLLVSKVSQEEALVPKEGFDLIKSMGLLSVPHKEHPPVSTWTDLNQKLKELYKEIKESPIETKEEGVVVYLVKKTTATGKEEIVSLSKLKTLEYQIFRKLREKLRSIGEKKHTRAEIEAKYQEEVKTLVGMYKTPHELSFYFEVAKKAFDFAETGEDSSHLIFGQFVSFLSVVVYCTITNTPFTMGFFDKAVLQELYSTPWSKYNDLKKKLKVSETFTPKTPRTIVFIPVTIPGMGKTFLFRDVIKPYCEENNLAVRMVSSDQIRKAEMNALSAKEPGLSENVLFARTRESADEIFTKLLINNLKERTQEDKVIFLDKNHPPNGVKKAIDLINAHKPRHADVRFLALMPKSKPSPPIKIGDKEVSYPFSLETCLSCLVTVQTRKNHETLNGNGADSAAIVLMFYNMFRDFKFDGQVLKDMGFNGGISVDFFGENTAFSKDALDKLTEILSKLPKAGDKPKDIQLIDQLMGLMQENFFNNTVTRPSKDVQTKCIANVLKNLPVERPPPPPSILTKIHPNHPTQLGTKALQPQTEKFWAEVSRDNDKRAKAYLTTPPGNAIAKKEYKPKKNPIYVGIFIKGDEKARIQNMIRYSLAKIQSGNTDPAISEDSNEFAQENLATWKWPEGSWHITTAFVGSEKNPSQEAFKTFEENVNFPFRLKHVVYVPGKLIVGIVYLDDKLIKCENKFPHITLATKNAPPKMSNDVLEALFGGVFYQRYKEGLKFGSDKISTLNINLGAETCNAFLFELPAEIYFDGETKAFGG
jgi:hypothetical protein